MLQQCIGLSGYQSKAFLFVRIQRCDMMQHLHDSVPELSHVNRSKPPSGRDHNYA